MGLWECTSSVRPSFIPSLNHFRERFSLNFTLMFLSVRLQCVEHTILLPRLKAKVTSQGEGTCLWISCPLHISWPLRRFSLSFTQIFLLLSWCAEPMIRLRRLNAKFTESRLCDFVSAPISWTLRTIFIKLHSNVPLSETECKVHDLATETKWQSHRSGAIDFPLNFVLAPYLLNPLNDFHQTFLSVRQCAESMTHLCRLNVNFVIQGHGILRCGI